MSEAFRDLGLRTELSDALAALGFDTPTTLQRAAIPVLRRGGNAALHASYGSGLTAAYGAALIDRVVEQGAADGAARVLVITPTAARAAAAAEQLGPLGTAVGLTVRALAPGWQDPEHAALVIGAVDNVAGAVARSALKLEEVTAVVIESLSALLAEGARDALESVLAALPRDAQRVFTFATADGEVERFIDAHARKALRIPARAADPVSTRGAPAGGAASYVVVNETAKPDALARLLVRSSDEEVLVTARSRERAEHVRALLEARGHAPADDGHLRVQSALEAPPRGARVIAYDVPMDVETLLHLHTGSGVILVKPSEVAHLQRIAEEAQVTLKAEKARTGDRDVGSAFRNEVRHAIQERDLEAQLLLLEPLFDEFAPVEVAAALSSLLRERRLTGAPEGGAPSAEADARTGSAPATFTRLFFSIGSRDNIRPGDLVGAITGEAAISGNEVGRIELRDTFSVVEVAAGVADKVIRALNGTTMRGRALRVDYDRRGNVPARGGGPGGGGGRSGARPPRRPRPEAQG